MSPELKLLKAANGLSDVASLLNVRPADLSYALYILPNEVKYRTFQIPKKGGGFRVIAAPESRLRYIQKQLADLLVAIELGLEAGRTQRKFIVSHGFKKKMSIVTNAKNHRNKEFVFNADLKDFFPSINFGRVMGFFVKNRDFGLKPKVATVLAQIACFNNKLPQGSPCSPVISNLIAGILDRHLSKMAVQHRCTYTRYADDLTFSTNERVFPEAIARRVRGAEDKWVAGHELVGRVARSGFQVNELKTRLQYRSSRQDTTGLVVNEKLNVPAEYYKLTRAMCFHLFRDGTAFAAADNARMPISDERLRGRLAHLYHIRGLENDHKKYPQKKGPAYVKLYGKFLDYIAFYGHQRPTIICEGKTDNIYIKTAIQMLAPKFPELVDVVGAEYKLKVKFFKYGKASSNLQDLSGGAGQLKTLIMDYGNRLSGFTSGAKNPVIMVLDVDKGTTQIWAELSKILGKSVAGHDPYYHVRDNLYVVPVPVSSGAEGDMEDLFDKKTLELEYDQKKFDKKSDKDMPGTYSKNTFANHVIRDNRATIDFSGFEPLLKSIRDVIADYATKI